MRKKLVSSSIAALTMAVCIVGLNTPAQARPRETRAFVYVCGRVTCSLYLKRGITQQLWNRFSPYANASNAAIAAAAAAACAPIGGVGAVVCGGGAAVYGGFFIDKLGQAAKARQCLRMRHLRTNPLGVNALYVDRSGYCKN